MLKISPFLKNNKHREQWAAVTLMTVPLYCKTNVSHLFLGNVFGAFCQKTKENLLACQISSMRKLGQ